jgi:hypothetical protein
VAPRYAPAAQTGGSMMRFLGLCIALSLMPGVPASAQGVNPQLRSCSAARDIPYCKVQRGQFSHDWTRANRGDYTSQRNVAFCLRFGCDGAVKVNKVAACAWRIVILGSDAPWARGDLMNYKADCAGIGGRGDAMAHMLFEKIYKRPLEIDAEEVAMSLTHEHPKQPDR